MLLDEKIILVVTGEYGLPREDIMRQVRTSKIVEARMVSAYCLRLLNNRSFPVIGKILGGRDHTTIMHACKKIALKIEKDKKFQKKLEKILDQIRNFNYNSVEPREKEVVEVKIEDSILPEPIVQPQKPRKKYIIPTENLMLNEREKSILEKYKKGMTFRQIAENIKLSTQRVVQIADKALLKEVGAKIKEGFEIDVYEYLKAEKRAHDKLRYSISDKERSELYPEFLSQAASYSSISEFAKKVGYSVRRLEFVFPDIAQMIEQKAEEKRNRWSWMYTKCRGCGTTKIHHFRKGYCEQCFGVYRGKRRELILEKKFLCSVCSLERGAAIQKYKRDLYITRDERVMCRGCFLQLTGGKLAESRISRR